MIAHIPGSAEPIRGRAAHAAAMGQFFRIFPDVHVHNDPYPVPFGSGDWITVISRTTGTFTGEKAGCARRPVVVLREDLPVRLDQARFGRADSGTPGNCSRSTPR
jgi:SnoaL-like polyketide cyclase